MAKNPHLNIIISQEDKDRLKQLADKEGRTMSQMAARLIKQGLDETEQQNQQQKQD